MKKGFKCILAVINDGYSDKAMEAAKACGAKGGTILHARGTASKEAEKFFNISIQPEKEMVMILAQNDLVDNILKGLYNSIGTSTAAQGIVFTLPVDDVVGINTSTKKKIEE